MRLAVNGKPPNAQLETRRNLCQCCLRARAASKVIGDNADVMAAICLPVGEIKDVADDAAHRRAYRVEDSYRFA
jgi:hypothetical protein